METIKIALVGAGGKMGCRLTDNFLKTPGHEVSYLDLAGADGNARTCVSYRGGLLTQFRIMRIFFDQAYCNGFIL